MRTVETELPRRVFFKKLREHRAGALLLDYDGTLAPFRADRNAAFPYPGMSSWLRKIMANGQTRVMLISGRPAAEVKSLLGILPAPEIWGVHGRQRLRPNGSCETFAIGDSNQQILEEAESWLQAQGLRHLAECKPGSIAVHWRGMPVQEADRIHGKIRAAWVSLAVRGGMSLLDFDGGIELRLADRNKGHAVLTVRQELEPGTPLAYLGDDVTDEDAFCALAGSDALTVLVRPEWRETNAELWVKPPEELLEFLREWNECCGGAR
ncbi:MAG: trehalose-phosphatase [Terriglobales bacterium]